MRSRSLRSLVAELGVDARGNEDELVRTAERLLSVLSTRTLPKRLARRPTTHEAVCLHLACERLGVNFNVRGAVLRSAVNEKAYRACLADARAVVGQPAGAGAGGGAGGVRGTRREEVDAVPGSPRRCRTAGRRESGGGGPAPRPRFTVPRRPSMRPMIDPIPYQETKKYLAYLEWRTAILEKIQTTESERTSGRANNC